VRGDARPCPAGYADCHRDITVGKVRALVRGGFCHLEEMGYALLRYLPDLVRMPHHCSVALLETV